MKKIFTILSAFIALFAVSFPASAQSGEDTTYPEIKVGETLNMTKANQDGVWQFTAPYTGTLTVQSTSFTFYGGHDSGGTFLYDSPLLGLDNQVEPYPPIDVENVGKLYEFSVTGGTTYYIAFGGVFVEPVSFTFNMEDVTLSPGISSIDPAPGTSTQYPFARYPQLQIKFNKRGTVVFGDCSLIFITEQNETKSIPLRPEKIDAGATNRWDLNIYAAIVEAKTQGLKADSEFTVSIKGITFDGRPIDGKYVNDDGDIVLNYLYGSLTSCIEANYPVPFLSYWRPDTPQAVMTFEFDGELMPQSDSRQKPVFQIFAGPYQEPTGGEDDGGWPMLPGAELTVSGKTVTVNLADVMRPSPDQKNVIGILKETPVVTVYVRDLLDINGNYIDYKDGEPRIEISDIPFVLLEKITPTYEFTPVSGSLANVAAIEFWIKGDAFAHFGIDGFTFSKEDDDEPIAVVSVDDTNAEADPEATDGSMIYNIPVPRAVKETAGKIILSVNTYTLDGYDYEISGSYTNPSSGVEAVEVENGVDTVYTIDGRKISGSLRTLAPGLYIVNGQKIIKK